MKGKATYLARQFLRLMKSGGMRCALIAVVMIAVSALRVYAQGSSNSLDETADNAFITIFEEWRWPICTLAMVPAAIAFWSGSPNGRTYALAIVIGIVAFALIPYFRDVMMQWTGT